MTKQTDIATKYFSKTGGYRGDIDLKILGNLETIYVELCNTEPTSGKGELQRDITLRGIEAEIEKYHAKIGKHVVDMWRQQNGQSS